MLDEFLQNLFEQGLIQYHGDTELALAWARTKLETFLRAQPEMDESMIQDYLEQMSGMVSQQ
jgi:hypothetical protein